MNDGLNSRWEDNGIQFPRLLAEIRAAGLTAGQYALLKESMDLSKKEIDSVLERAEKAWESIKDGVCATCGGAGVVDSGGYEATCEDCLEEEP